MKVGVIGLGIVGLSVCVRLAEAGHDVLGIEQFDLRHAHGSSHGDTRIFRGTPAEGPIYLSMAERSLPLWTRWEHLADQQFLDWTGGIFAGPPGSTFIHRGMALADSHNRSIRLYTPDAANERFGIRIPDHWSVYTQDDCAVIQADALQTFLAAYALRLGVKLRTKTQYSTSPATIHPLNSDLPALDVVIVAAGAWTPTLFPELRSSIAVQRRIVGWLRPREAAPPLSSVLLIDTEAGVFGMPTQDGLYKIGLHRIDAPLAAPADAAPSSDADRDMLAEQARAFLPSYQAAPVRMSTCLYAVTEDENFIVAPDLLPRTLVFSCCSGHGFKYAPVYGEIALDWLSGASNEFLDAFAPRASAPTQ